MWTWWGWGVCGEQKAIFSQFFPPQGPGSKSSVHPDSKCFTYRTPTPFQHSPALYSRRLILRRGLIFFFRLVLNLLGLGFWPSCLKFLSIRDYGLLSSGLCLQFFISTHLELCVCVWGGCQVPKCTYGGLSVLATLFHLWKTADAWSTTILTALLSNLKRASDSWVPGWQVYTATHGCSSCTTPLEFSQSSFQQR